MKKKQNYNNKIIGGQTELESKCFSIIKSKEEKKDIINQIIMNCYIYAFFAWPTDQRFPIKIGDKRTDIRIDICKYKVASLLLLIKFYIFKGGRVRYIWPTKSNEKWVDRTGVKRDVPRPANVRGTLMDVQASSAK